jgi:ferric-dicitrate binding protein FerR (iron transport regulator)
MKTERNSRQQAELFEKYLDGEMSGAEAHAFEEKISFLTSGSPHTRKAWNKLHDRLQHDQLIPEQRISAKNRFVFPLLKIAATVLILLGVGAVIYLNLIPKPTAEMVELNTANEANTLIKTLPDGSVIYVAENSLFTFPEKFESGSREVKLKGEAFFDVAPDPAQPFVIETEEALIEVLGTAFNVKTKNGNGFELFVDRGKVKVTLKSDPSKSEMVAAGEKISTRENDFVKSKFVANEATSWYKHRMHFKDEPLQQIINVLNRNFNTTFVLADHKTGTHKLTVTFENESPETMTELICVTLNLKSQIINGNIVFFENREGAKRN